MRSRQAGVPSKIPFYLDLLFLPVYPGLCKPVLGSCLQVVYPLNQTGALQRMVGKNEFAASSSDDFEVILANQIFELRELWLVGHEIAALRVEPKSLEPRVINEDVRSARCIRAVFQIEITPIQNQGVALYINRYGRQRPVIMVHD